MTENISFVVQGPVSHESNHAEDLFSTKEVLTSIRRNFPYSEIVLSTWNGGDITDLDYDKLVLNDDPGGIVVPNIEKPYNHNRLVLSSTAGIAVATKDFVVKTRTDIFFDNDNILYQLPQVKPIEGSYAIFKSYILSTNYYVRNPLRMNLLFHPSDIVLVGRRDDMKLFFSAPPVTRQEMVNERKQIKMVAEQYLMLKSIETAHNKHYSVSRVDYTNTTHFMESEKYLFINFNFLSIGDFGARFPERLLFAHLPDANYSLDEVAVLTNYYRKSDRLDGFSYLRAAKYLGARVKLYLKAKRSNLLNRVYSNDTDN
jgi:hypothetical protein